MRLAIFLYTYGATPSPIEYQEGQQFNQYKTWKRWRKKNLILIGQKVLETGKRRLNVPTLTFSKENVK